MQIELIDDPDLVAKMGYAVDQDRTRQVLHQSDIIKDLMCDLQPKRFKRVPFAMNPMVETGILFESILEEAMSRKFSTVRPGEVVSDEGVYMSPDGVNPILLAGEEYKATWMSSRLGVTDEYGQPLPKFLHWFIQMRGYAKWLDVRDFVLRVFFVNGNYRHKEGDPESGPHFKSYRIQFTDQEVDENWRMLIRHAQSKGML
jgi:hypothetical protein